MEDREGNSQGTSIPKKSRSLDLKSLYKSKATKETAKKSLKRKGRSPGGGDEKRNKRKKTIKEVSLSSLENADGSSKKIASEECHGGASSRRRDLRELKLGVSQRLNSSSGFNRVSLSLDDDGVRIPKRKRAFVRRKKFEVGKGPNLEGQTSGKSGRCDQTPKLSGDDLDRAVESSKIKQENDFDEFKENRSSDSNSIHHFKGNKDCAHHSVVNSGDSSLKKSRRKDRKRNILIPDSTRVVKEAEPLIDCSKICDDLHEDDEENLEENAARMLSSRFDPSCTGFSSSSKSSMLPSTNSLSFLLSSGRNFVSRGSKSLSGSESASVDAAGRVLRPRKQHKEKGSSRKRRHFYEIFLGDLDAYWVLNRRIKVFWPLDQRWYYGLVNDYDKEKQLHHIKYDDRDEEWINLQTERFKLLLLPSEVPGNSGRKRAVMKSRSSAEQKGSKSRKQRQRREPITEHDSCSGSCMDSESEPIISWLTRSSHRVKSSPFHGIKKQKTSVTPPNMASSSLYDEPVIVQECSAKSSLRGDNSLQDEVGDSSRKKSSMQSATYPKDGKPPIVYFRRRFRKPASISHHMSEENCGIDSAHGCISFDPVVCRIGYVKEPIDRRVKIDGPLFFTYNAGISKISFLDMDSAAYKFDLNFPVRLVLDNSFESENLWLLRAVLLLQYGTLMTKWPRVHLEMLFVDNVVGLRFSLFEGCLRMAAAFVFMVLRVFHQPADRGKCDDLQLPVTSIRFRFSCVDNIKQQLVFAFYNFARVKNSNWMYLDSKLKRYCLLSKQLHCSECTYDNIRALQNGLSDVSTTFSGEPSSFKGMRKRTWPGINIMGASKESTKVDISQSSDAGNRKFLPFALSFAAAPTFFLSLHLKLLMEQSVAQINLVDDQENSGLLTDGCFSTGYCSTKNLEINLENNIMTLSKGPACDGWSFAEADVINGPFPCSNGILPDKYKNIGISGSGTSDSHGFERLGANQLQEWPDHSGSPLCSLPSGSLIDKGKADDGSHSFLDDLSVQMSSVNQIEKPIDVDLHGTQHSYDSSSNVNGNAIPSPNPTAPRSTWHRNRNSSSFGLLSNGWSDGKVDCLHNGFSNGPKRPRTQVSYSLPFAGYDISSRHRSHHQKGFSHKRIRKANEKKSSDVAKGPERNLESLSCDANVLITLGDKGWRESGAQVVLELFDHNEWKLSVKLFGVTRYSYKAHQFLQPGSTNRYTHAMMWKGGKDWVLEFTDRSQWALFKEMHEECYNRNIRAASVKNIPIPGVGLIEENDDNGPEVAFVRSSKYFRQVETDVEMALNPLHVLYDMDSEDEQWLSDIRNSEEDNSGLEAMSEEMFEKTMDMFEKAAYTQQRDLFTPNEIEELMADVRPLNVVKTIYEHWQRRRQKKGMALIRHFQPPLWERYQQQMRDWEVAMNKSNTPISNGCLDKVAALEKPPMFAFCLKPRGLEVLNKGSKQRSQKKFSVSGQTNSILGDQEGFHTFGRRLNGFAFGDEKFTYQGHHYDSFDDSPLPQTSPRVLSPWDAGSVGHFLTINDGFDRNHSPKLHRNKSKKYGSSIYPNDPQMMTSYSPRMSGKRNGVSRWNMGYYDMPGHRHYYMDGPQRHGIEKLDGSDLDEFKLRDASSAAQHALNMAKLKRERAQRLHYRADLAIHKAVVALMTAEAIKASEDLNGDD